MFFSILPNLKYSPKRVSYRYTENEFILAKNIFKSLAIENEIYSSDLFAEYIIKDGARPDFIAENLYGNANYDWVILVTNKIMNLYNDWPLAQKDFENYVFAKYDNPSDIHHYETIEIRNDYGDIVQPEGIEVYFDPADQSSYTLKYMKSWTKNSNGSINYNALVEEVVTGEDALISISNYEYEEKINEKKRIIQILKPAYLQNFVKLFTASVQYNSNDDLIDSKTKSTST